MAAFERFEDIGAWRRSRELARDVYAATSTTVFARDYGLWDQIRRAAVSIMSNLADVFERYGSIEFRRFLSIARGSAGEVKPQLYEKADAVSQLVGWLMRYLSTQNDTRRTQNPEPRTAVGERITPASGRRTPNVER